MHNCRFGRVKPATNAQFWHAKRTATRLRDRKNIRALRRLGWDVLIVWECWTRNPDRLKHRLQNFLTPAP